MTESAMNRSFYEPPILTVPIDWDQLRAGQVRVRPERAELRDRIYTAYLEINQVDDDINFVEAILTKLKSRRTEIRTRVDAWKSIQAPIRRLPPEILAEIFSLCHPLGGIVSEPYRTGTTRLQHIRQACFWWQQVVDTTPSLWTNIQLDFGRHRGNLESLLNHYVQRSANCLLGLDLLGAPSEAPESDVKAVFTRIASLAPRFGRLGLDHSMFKFLSGVKFPHLTRLAVTNADGLLKTLQIDHPLPIRFCADLDEIAHGCFPLQRSNMATLATACFYDDIDLLYNVIEGQTTLCELEVLIGVHGGNPRRVIAPDASSLVPNLRKLAFDLRQVAPKNLTAVTTQLAMLLHPLTLPVLEEFVIQSDDPLTQPIVDCIHALFLRSQCRLTTLHIYSLFPSPLIPLLHFQPTLQHLHLDACLSFVSKVLPMMKAGPRPPIHPLDVHDAEIDEDPEEWVGLLPNLRSFSLDAEPVKDEQVLLMLESRLSHEQNLLLTVVIRYPEDKPPTLQFRQRCRDLEAKHADLVIALK